MRKGQIVSKVKKHYTTSYSWSKTSKYFNELYGINLSKTAYRNWVEVGREPANKIVRLKLGLFSYTCPTCKRKIKLVKPTIVLEKYMKWWRNSSIEERRIKIKMLYEQQNKEG